MHRLPLEIRAFLKREPQAGVNQEQPAQGLGEDTLIQTAYASLMAIKAQEVAVATEEKKCDFSRTVPTNQQ